MKEVALVIENCQSTSVPSAPPAIQHAVAILKTLDFTKPLQLHDPAYFFARPSPQDKAPRVSKEPNELTAVARDTRAKLRAAIFKRFGKKRYGRNFREESHLFDMALAFNPAMRQHGYIDQLAETPAVAKAVKAKIWEQITGLTEMAVVAKRAEAATTAAAIDEEEGDIGEQERESSDTCQKRLKMGPEQDVAVMSALEDAGIFDQPVVEPVSERESAEKSAYEEAKEVVTAWRMAQVI